MIYTSNPDAMQKSVGLKRRLAPVRSRPAMVLRLDSARSMLLRHPADGWKAATRAIIAAEIERLIDLLDTFDGDPDLEPEFDTGVDDTGEPDSITWR